VTSAVINPSSLQLMLIDVELIGYWQLQTKERSFNKPFTHGSHITDARYRSNRENHFLL